MNALLHNTVDQKYDRTISIVTFDYRFEALLSCSVPYLQLDVKLLVDFDHFGGEFNPCIGFSVPTVTVC
jgi:hypothetical protein